MPHHPEARGGSSEPPLQPGAHLGHYVIRRFLGAGGMGEVYEADDTRLGRRIALKVVRHDLATDPDRRARLEREATAAAALSHPHVVTVYSLEYHEDVAFISMELIEGTTLDRLVTGRGMPLGRLLPLAIQIADAVSAAHAAGVIHRDLKPANVMLTPGERIKVLDFGLSGTEPASATDTAATDHLTASGTLMGTTAYLSPEQIDGRPADARSDLFALGVILFEMATGRRPFAGATPLATISAISRDPAPLANTINPEVPDELAWVIDRCLAKDPAERLQSALDLRHRLEDLARSRLVTAAVSRSAGRHARARPALLTAAVGTAVAVAAVVMGMAARNQPPPRDNRVTRFVVELPAGQVMYSGFNPLLAFSPDGSRLAMTPLPGPVYIRQVDDPETRTLEASLSPAGWRDAPVFSPDGAFLSYIEGNAIASSVRPFYKAALSGGAPLKLADYDAFHRGDWSRDGWIYWTAQYPGGVVRTAADGGGVEAVTELDTARGERSHRFARLLPGDGALLITVAAQDMQSYDEARIDLVDLRTRRRTPLIHGGTAAVYSPSGHLVYARAGKLMAVGFDLARQRVTSTPFEVLDGVLMSDNTGAAQFALSQRGDLAYVPGKVEGGRRRLVWVDRHGQEEPLPLQPAAYLHPRLSFDGRLVATEIEGPNHDVHVYDIERGVLTKLTTDGMSHGPVWSPDSARLAFRSWIAGGMTLWMMPVDRSAPATRLDPSGTRQSPSSISPDHRFLAIDQKDPATRDDVWVLPLTDNASPIPIARSKYGEGSAKFSPDGRWLAYVSDESGRSEVYVQAFPGPGPRLQISTDGGSDPVWRRSGGELFYRSGSKMMAVSVTTAPTFTASKPQLLWERPYASGAGSSCGMPGPGSSNYDVTPDGERFLMVREDDAWLGPNRVVVVLNWAEEITRKAGR